MIRKILAYIFRNTNAQRIADQIAEVEKAVLENQATADHYQALADGGNRTLARLRALQPSTAPVPTPRAARAPASTKTAVAEQPEKAVAAKSVRRVA
jgi:hypothetical protein